ncbi:MAG: recombinase family protein [Acidimicrobiales bacterium]
MTPRRGARAIIYTRISLDRTGESLSPDRQETLCRAQAEAKGWNVVEVTGDRDRSGWKRGVDRPGFDRVEQAVRDGAVDVVMAYSLSRFGRRAVGLLEFAELLKDHGVGMSCVDQGIDTTTASGKMFFTILAAFAEMESETTSTRVKSAHSVAAQGGKAHSGGRRSFGYNRDETILEAEAVVAREAAGRLMAGESLRRVATDLNERGITTTTGRTWSGSTLKQALTAPRMTGLRQHGEDMHEGGWAAILDRATWTALRAKMDRPTGRPPSEAHLLSGIVRCGVCGGKLKQQTWRRPNGASFGKYQCLKRPGTENCGGVTVSKGSLDAFVRDEWLAFMTEAELQPSVESVEAATATLDDVTGRLADLARDHYVDRVIDRAMFLAAKGPLDLELTDAELALSTATREREERQGALLPGDRDGLAAWWEAAPVAERRAALARAIDHVSVMPAKQRGGNRFDDSRVLVEWSGRVYGLDRVVGAVKATHVAERRPAVIRG